MTTYTFELKPSVTTMNTFAFWGTFCIIIVIIQVILVLVINVYKF